MMLLALLLVTMPAAGLAQELPQLFTEVYESIGEGLSAGAKMAMQERELTLSMVTDGERLEEGGSLLLTVTAGNPLPYETKVGFALTLPQHVTADGETAWEAVLAPAALDEETGEMVPSETVITRKLSLAEGGESAHAEILCEMSMGTRFYRALEPLQLCVPNVSVSAHADGTTDGRLNPGDSFAWRVALQNSGDAPKEMALELTLPEAAEPDGALPAGFVQADGKLSGVVQVPAAQDETPASMEIIFPAKIAQSALEGDADAQRLIAPQITLDGERVAAPRIQVCGPRIHARMLTDRETLETGEETTLSVVVVNSGLAEADVTLSCMLPQGLSLADAGEEDEEENKLLTAAQGDDQLPGAGEAIPAEDGAAAPVMHREDRQLMFDLHMDAARQTEDGVIANTQVIEIPVRAEIAQGRMTQQMLGASLAWSVGGEQAELGEAVAMSVRPQTVMGLTRADWNGVFWAGVLLLVTLVCLYAAVKKEKREEDYCFE